MYHKDEEDLLLAMEDLFSFNKDGIYTSAFLAGKIGVTQDRLEIMFAMFEQSPDHLFERVPQQNGPVRIRILGGCIEHARKVAARRKAIDSGPKPIDYVTKWMDWLRTHKTPAAFIFILVALGWIIGFAGGIFGLLAFFAKK